MDYLAAIASLASVGLGIAVAILGIRNGGLRADARHADTLRKAAEGSLHKVADEFDDYRDRAESKEARLVAELEHYENHALDGIENEPNREVRIRRRRDWVRSLLSQTSTTTGDNSDSGMRDDSAS